MAKGKDKNRRNKEKDEQAPNPAQQPVNHITAIPPAAFHFSSRLPFPDEPDPTRGKNTLSHAVNLRS